MKQAIFIGLPGADLLADFPGFEEIDRLVLPDGLRGLVIPEDDFEEQFPDIVGKLRAKSGR